MSVWCAHKPEHKTVRGWTVADCLEVAPGRYHFCAHSIVETETGKLIDLTPNPLPWEYPFLRHEHPNGDAVKVAWRAG